MEIAIELDDDRNIIGVNNTNNLAAETQANEKGWTLIQNSDPAFSIENMYEWTVRESDSKLVHISTGKTPDEENKDALAELTKQNLAGQLTDTQVQAAVTDLTKQNLQLTQDSANYKTAITALTQQIAELKTANTNTTTATTPDTNTNTATTTTTTADTNATTNIATTADTNTATTAESK